MHTFLIMAAAALALLHAQSHAEIAGAFTVEWLTCASDVVAVGKVTSVKTVTGPHPTYEDCILTVSEIIKGSPTETVSFCYRHGPQDSIAWTTASELLVCLSIYKTPYDEKRLHLYTDPYYEVRLHNLLMPTNGNYTFSIIDLSAPEGYVFSGNLKALKTRYSILQTARSAAAAFAARRKSDPDFRLIPRRIWVDDNSEPWKVLYRRSACFLQAPEFMFPEPKK